MLCVDEQMVLKASILAVMLATEVAHIHQSLDTCRTIRANSNNMCPTTRKFQTVGSWKTTVKNYEGPYYETRVQHIVIRDGRQNTLASPNGLVDAWVDGSAGCGQVKTYIKFVKSGPTHATTQLTASPDQRQPVLGIRRTFTACCKTHQS